MSSVSHTQSIMLGNTLNLVSYTHHVFSQSSCSAVVEDKARQHAGRNMALYNQLVAQAKASINPGFRFYQQKLSVQFHNINRAFKAAHLCCPIQVQSTTSNCCISPGTKAIWFYYGCRSCTACGRAAKLSGHC